FSLRTLRVMELTTLTVLVAVLVWSEYFEMIYERLGSLYSVLGQGTLQVPRRPLFARPDSQPTHIFRYSQFDRFMWTLAGWKAAHWVLLLVGYGLFIPNTWRRATVVITLLAVLPILLNGLVCLIDPDITRKHA